MTDVGTVRVRFGGDTTGLDRAIRSADSSIAGFATKATRVLNALGIGIGIAAIGRFAKAVLDTAGQLQDLSEQTGISAQSLAGIKIIAEQSGSSIEEFANGVRLMLRSLAESDQQSRASTEALKRLGFTTNELLRFTVDAEGFIDAFSKKLAAIKNPAERMAISMDIASRAGGRMGAVFQEIARQGGLNEIRKQASAFSPEVVKALDDVGDAMTRLKNASLGFGAIVFAGFLRGIGAIEPTIELLEARLERLRKFTPANVIEIQEVERLLNEARQKLAAAQSGVPKPLIPGISDEERKKLEAFRETLRKQVQQFQVSTVEITKGRQAALELSLEFERLNSGVKISDAEFGKLKGKVLEAASAFSTAQIDAALLEESLKSLEEAFPEPETIGDMAKATGEFGIMLRRALGELTAEDLKVITEAEKSLERIRSEMAIALAPPETREALRIWEDFKRIQQEIIDNAKIVGLSEEETAKRVAEAWKAAQQKIKEGAEATSEFQRRLQERLADAVTDLTRDAVGGQIRSWEELGKRVKRVLDEIFAQLLNEQIRAAFKPGGAAGGLFPALFGFFDLGGTGAAKTAAASTLDFGSLAGLGIAGFLHQGGIVGETNMPKRLVDPALFAGAPRLHGGGVAGLGIREVPAILEEGEEVIPRNARGQGRTTIVMNINTPDANSFRRSQSQIEAEVAIRMERARRRSL